MAHPTPLTAQLVADLFLAIEHDDAPATFAATRALAERIGETAALALARGLINDRSMYLEPVSSASSDPLSTWATCA